MQLYQLLFPSGKSYIGVTSKTAQERFKQHCKQSRKKNPCQLAIHKYGKENVIINILAECDNWELLCLAEQEAIEKFKTKSPSGYNLTDGGDGIAGFKLSDATKHKMSIAGKLRMSNPHEREITIGFLRKNHPLTAESYKKISDANKGKKRSKETRDKISEKAKGRIASEETREKLSKIHKGVLHTDEHKAKISLALKGNMSDENKKKLSLLKKGVPRSAETIKKMSDANLGKKQSEETRRKRSESMKATIALKKHTLIAEKIKDLIESLHVIESIEEN
jgi:group I intron endonuclease